MPGSAFCTVPGCSLPAVATGGQAGYADAWLNILGVLSQSTQRANYDQDGKPQAPGTPVAREIASDEYELYMQDSWQIRPNLTITAGVRYSLYSPPYEVNGLQVAPTISMGEWFDERVRTCSRASRRTPARSSPSTSPARRTTSRASTRGTRTTSRRASPWRGRRRNAWSSAAATRRCSIASASAWRRTSTKASRSACRRRSAARSAPPMRNPAGAFREPTTLPPTVPAAPPGGFPQTPPQPRRHHHAEHR